MLFLSYQSHLMRYLLFLFLILHSASCLAQPGLRGLRRGPAGYEKQEGTTLRVEVGVSGGFALVNIARQGSYDRDLVGNGNIWLTEVDFCHDANKFPVAFRHGARLGNDVFDEAFVSYVGGLQFNTAPRQNLGLRLTLMTGPMLSSLRPDWLGEISAGVLLWQRLSVGVKYMRPFWSITTATAHEGPNYGSDYRASYLLAEVKIRCGSRP